MKSTKDVFGFEKNKTACVLHRGWSTQYHFPYSRSVEVEKPSLSVEKMHNTGMYGYEPGRRA